MPLLQVQNVSKTFPNGVRALQGVTLQVEPGEVVVVLGPSGAGKSTLLRTINGLESPTSGQIDVAGLQVKPATVRKIRRMVGMVFQQFNLVPRLSVMANVLTGRLGYRGWTTTVFFAFPKEDHDLAQKAIDRVGLTGREWDRAEKLSGGQQQRVAIARTLVQNPKVILADEPVASLDPATSVEIMDLLVTLARENQTALILNLHQVELARQYADRIVGIKSGRSVFDKTPSDITDQEVEELYRAG